MLICGDHVEDTVVTLGKDIFHGLLLLTRKHGHKKTGGIWRFTQTDLYFFFFYISFVCVCERCFGVRALCSFEKISVKDWLKVNDATAVDWLMEEGH